MPRVRIPVANTPGGLAPKVSVDLSGPLFERDVKATVRENIRTMLQGIAEEGASSVRDDMAFGEGGRQPISDNVSPDRESEWVFGRVRSLAGKPWALTAVISINNHGLSSEQGIALMAGAARVESETHAFRQAASGLRGARAILAADLTRNLE